MLKTESYRLLSTFSFLYGVAKVSKIYVTHFALLIVCKTIIVSGFSARRLILFL